MGFEKPNYAAGDPEKARKAQERAKAIQEGRLPEFEAAQQDKPGPEKPKDFLAGDSEKLKANRQRLESLYPQKQGEEEKEAA